jgi:hypothetical protein
MNKVFELKWDEDNDSITVYEKENTYVIESVDHGKKESSEFKYSSSYPKGFKWNESEIFAHGMKEMAGIVKDISKLN